MSMLQGGRTASIRLGLSFIDVVSGGFGAAFFLFLVFATLPLVEAPVRGGGSHYIDVLVAWEPPLLFLNLIVEHVSPDGNSRQIDLTDHRRFVVEADGSVNVRPRGRADRFWDHALAAGVARRGAAMLQHEPKSGRRGTWLRIARPCPGTLTFRLAPDGVDGSILVNTERTSYADVYVTIADAKGRRIGAVENYPVIRTPIEKGYKRRKGGFEIYPVNTNGNSISQEISVDPEDIGDYCRRIDPKFP